MNWISRKIAVQLWIPPGCNHCSDYTIIWISLPSVSIHNLLCSDLHRRKAHHAKQCIMETDILNMYNSYKLVFKVPVVLLNSDTNQRSNSLWPQFLQSYTTFPSIGQFVWVGHTWPWISSSVQSSQGQQPWYHMLLDKKCPTFGVLWYWFMEEACLGIKPINTKNLSLLFSSLLQVKSFKVCYSLNCFNWICLLCYISLVTYKNVWKNTIRQHWQNNI